MPETDEAIPDASAMFDKRTTQYIAVRYKMREIKARQEEELKPLVDLHNDLTSWFIEVLDGLSAQSVKTGQGTVYQNTSYTSSVTDPKAFMDHVITNQSWDLLDPTANPNTVRDYVERHNSEPPGVKLSAIRTVGVRRAFDPSDELDARVSALLAVR
jgi:hypothetical protein